MMCFSGTKQAGATLVIALVILLIMTLIGVAGMKTSTLQERMASNARQKIIAKTAAEAALLRAEEWLKEEILSPADIARKFNDTGENKGTFAVAPLPMSDEKRSAAPAVFAYGTDPKVWLAQDLGKSLDSNDINSKFSPSMIAHQPRYIIEYIGRDTDTYKVVNSLDTESQGDGTTDPYIFRITAIGWGRDPEIYVVLESTFRTGYGDFTY